MSKSRALELCMLARHQLEKVYPFVHNPRMFIGILTLLARAHEEIILDGAGQERLAHIREMLRQHRQSPVTFPRENVIVVCDDAYGLTSITKAHVSFLLEQTELMVKQC